MNLRSFARAVALILAVASVFPAAAAEQLTLLNVSYDPTRELWRDINEHFIADYKTKTGIKHCRVEPPQRSADAGRMSTVHHD